MSFSLSYELSHLDVPEPVDVAGKLRATETYWLDWAAKNKIESPWDEAVVRR